MPVQRLQELRKRRTRRAKVSSLRRKYAAARTDDERNRVLTKLNKVHPMLSNETFLQPLKQE